MAESCVNMATIFPSNTLLKIYTTQIFFQIELNQIKWCLHEGLSGWLSYQPDYKWIINFHVNKASRFTSSVQTMNKSFRYLLKRFILNDLFMNNFVSLIVYKLILFSCLTQVIYTCIPFLYYFYDAFGASVLIYCNCS